MSVMLDVLIFWAAASVSFVIAGAWVVGAVLGFGWLLRAFNRMGW